MRARVEDEDDVQKVDKYSAIPKLNCLKEINFFVRGKMGIDDDDDDYGFTNFKFLN